VSEAKGTRRRDLGSLVGAGRRLVQASADVPKEALGFLGHRRLGRRGRPPEGSAPGAIAIPRDAVEPVIRVMSYDGGTLEERTIVDVAELGEIVGVSGRTTWIDVTGFGDRARLEAIQDLLGIHPLAMADVVHVPQRPKAELHDDHLLVVTQMARVSDDGDVNVEQASLVLGPGWVVSFQDRPGDLFDPIRERIRQPGTRIRRMGADYLLYALVDAVIDGYFAVVEALGGVIDALEEEVVEGSGRASLARIHATRRKLLELHRVQWRQLDAVNLLLRAEDLPISEAVRPYMRDAHDHAFQTLDALETFRDMVVGLMDLQLSSASHRLNEVMKTLTIVATIFIPLTFMSGVYGMNFEYMPELRWHWGYPTFWASMTALGAGLLFWFHRRGWLGDGED
jgi:magnesium transporter